MSKAKALAASMAATKAKVAAQVMNAAFRPTFPATKTWIKKKGYEVAWDPGFRFDISEPKYAQIDLSLGKADTEALENMWRVKFGDEYVSEYVLVEMPLVWRCIAHLLWRRKKMHNIDFATPVVSTADSDINPLKQPSFESKYRLNDGNS